MNLDKWREAMTLVRDASPEWTATERIEIINALSCLMIADDSYCPEKDAFRITFAIQWVASQGAASLNQLRVHIISDIRHRFNYLTEKC